MATNAPPSTDPANQDSLEGAFSAILRKYMQGIDNGLPARVVSYDRATNRATVVPMIAMKTTLGAQVNRATIGSVPVLRIGGGNHVLSFNLQAGDLGWLQASDRDISVFLQNPDAPSVPNTYRMHSFEDALFIPDALRGVTVAGENADRVVLQTLDGSVYIALGDDTIKIKNGAASITLTPTNVDIVGTLRINGSPYLAHTHNGVQPGAGNSGGVNP